MMRYVKSTTELSDGTVLPAGAMIMIADDAVRDAEMYAEPGKFDAYRYLRKRERAGEENRRQFVTTSPDNLAFGHGQHACPGKPPLFFTQVYADMVRTILRKHRDESAILLHPAQI